MQVDSFINTLTRDVTDYTNAVTAMNQGATATAARAHAQKDMAGPREVIDTLRHEATIWSVAPVGILDIGRLWPDPNGTRFAIGAGGRFSIVNFSVTGGYAVNPHPYKMLGQGRGAFFFSFTYANLFR